MAVDGVAHRHVVGRHALGDRAGGAADAEEPAHHFLARADLGKRAVAARIEIDPERLGMGIDVVLLSRGENGTLLSINAYYSDFEVTKAMRVLPHSKALLRKRRERHLPFRESGEARSVLTSLSRL